MTASQNTKKLLWIHLTEEFNSIESNAKRSEAQLKKCWDNLKTRRKHFLANEKRQRMKTGGGQCVPNEPQPGSSNETLIFAEVLLDQTDVELRGDIDSDTIYSSEDIAMELETSVPAAAQPQQNDEVLRGNVRTRVIQEEFKFRKESYEKKERREDELFQFQKKEREWMMKAAEEVYLKAKAEREAAEDIKKYNRATRDCSEK